MRPSVLQRIDLSVRHAAPIALTLIIVVLNVVPLRLPAYPILAPDFALMAVFYWTVHRPDLMPAWAVFIVGLLDDILTGAPLGANALVLVVVHAVIIGQHRLFRGMGFAIIWWAFSVTVPLAHLLDSLVGLAAIRAPIDPAVLAIRAVLTAAVYPVLAWLLGRAQRAFLPAV